MAVAVTTVALLICIKRRTNIHHFFEDLFATLEMNPITIIICIFAFDEKEKIMI